MSFKQIRRPRTRETTTGPPPGRTPFNVNDVCNNDVIREARPPAGTRFSKNHNRQSALDVLDNSYDRLGGDAVVDPLSSAIDVLSSTNDSAKSYVA